jgi:hypothetical protein
MDGLQEIRRTHAGRLNNQGSGPIDGDWSDGVQSDPLTAPREITVTDWLHSVLGAMQDTNMV